MKRPKTKRAAIVAHRVIIKPEIYRELKRIEAETDEKPFDQVNRVLADHLKQTAAKRKK